MVNDETLALIKRWEGLRLLAYQDVAGKWTIGYGHTGTARQGMRITEAEAEALLREDLAVAERAVASLIQVELNENQRGALVSFTYNVGAKALRDSALRKKLNAGDYTSVPAQLARWNKAGDRVVDGLVNRRAAEAGLWARGSFVASNTAPVTAPKEALPRPVHAAGGAVIAGGLTWAAENASSLLTPLSGLDWRVALGVLLLGAAGFFLWQRSRAAAP